MSPRGNKVEGPITRTAPEGKVRLVGFNGNADPREAWDYNNTDKADAIKDCDAKNRAARGTGFDYILFNEMAKSLHDRSAVDVC